MSRFGLGFVSGANGNDAFTKILLHFDGTNGSTSIADVAAGGSAHPWLPVNASLSTSSFKFGTASFVTGSGGYVATADSSDFTLSSSDFTVDAWVDLSGTAGGSTRYWGGQSDASGTDFSFWLIINSSNQMSAVVFSGGVSAQVTAAASAPSSGLFHYALERFGSTLTQYVNGSADGSAAISGSVRDSAGALAIGRLGDIATAAASGIRIDEFRFSVGTARFRANFTPPTAQYI